MMEIFRFFSIYFVLAILFIALGYIIVDIEVGSTAGQFSIDLLANIFITLGAALLISNLFNHILGTNAFISYISKILRKIVISRDFLEALEYSEKRRMLKDCVAASEDGVKIYPNVEEFFNRNLDHFLRFFDQGFRGHMLIDVNAKVDQDRKRVYLVWNTSHVLFHTDCEKPNFSFQMSTQDFSCEEVSLEAPDGTRRVYGKTELEQMEQEATLAGLERSVEIPFPSEFEGFKEITVRRKVIEYGHDHWILFWHKASKPCHRMNVTVRCDPGLVIREFLTLGTNDGISIEFDDCKRDQMSFHHNGWLDSGHGVAAVISAEDDSLRKNRSLSANNDVS